MQTHTWDHWNHSAFTAVGCRALITPALMSWWLVVFSNLNDSDSVISLWTSVAGACSAGCFYLKAITSSASISIVVVTFCRSRPLLKSCLGKVVYCTSVPQWGPCLWLTCIEQSLCTASLFLQSLPSKHIFWRVWKRVWKQILSQSGRGQCCCGMHGWQGHSYRACLHRLHCLKVMQSHRDLSWKGPLDRIWSKLLLQLCQDSQGHIRSYLQ